MKEQEQKMKLPKLDDLFTTQAERDFENAEKVEEIDSIIEFTFENKKIEVPKTGDESNIKLFAGIILLSLAGIVYIAINNYKKNKNYLL